MGWEEYQPNYFKKYKQKPKIDLPEKVLETILSFSNYPEMKSLRLVSKKFRDGITGEILQRAIIYDQTVVRVEPVENEKISKSYYEKIKEYFDEKGIEITPQ
jgi:hypothetical protein